MNFVFTVFPVILLDPALANFDDSLMLKLYSSDVIVGRSWYALDSFQASSNISQVSRGFFKILVNIAPPLLEQIVYT